MFISFLYLKIPKELSSNYLKKDLLCHLFKTLCCYSARFSGFSALPCPSVATRTCSQDFAATTVNIY